MVLCRFVHTSKTEDLKSFGRRVVLSAPNRFPDDVVWIEVGVPLSCSEGPDHEISYENLANLITKKPKRFDMISIGCTSDTSPEYLSFFSAACEKTKSLSVHHEVIRNPQLYACLNTHLVDGGIEEFAFYIHELSPQEMAISAPLFQGIAQSSSLKKLEIWMASCDFQGNQLIRALEQNQTLKALNVEYFPPDWDQNDNTVIQRIFRATIELTQVSELVLWQPLSQFRMEDATQILDQNVFIECLVNPSCVIEKLHLKGIKVQREPVPSDEMEYKINSYDNRLVECLWELENMLRDNGRGGDRELLEILDEPLGQRAKSKASVKVLLAVFDEHDASRESVAVTNNTSVKELHITNSKLNCLQLRKILPRFKSLVELHLRYNRLWDISSVMNIVPSLHTLSLQGNLFDEDDIEALLAKLPNMSSIKSLDLRNNPCVWSGKFLNKAGVAALENAALQNNKIERLQYCHVDEDFEDVAYEPDEDDFDLTEIREYRSQYDKKQIKAHLSINRGGRAYLQKSTLPAGIWPLMLERAMKIKYCGWSGSMTMTDTRKDAVYWLLREKILTGSMT